MKTRVLMIIAAVALSVTAAVAQVCRITGNVEPTIKQAGYGINVDFKNYNNYTVTVNATITATYDDESSRDYTYTIVIPAGETKSKSISAPTGKAIKAQESSAYILVRQCD